MLLVAGPASVELARRISEVSGLRISRLSSKLFPDGETYFRFEEKLESEDVVIIQGTHPPQNKNLIDLLLLAHSARSMDAERVLVVAPYLAYMRQDKSFLDGEVVSSKAIMEVFEKIQVDKLVTIDAHAPWIFEDVFMPVENLSGVRLVAEHMRELDLSNPAFVSPGKKAQQILREVAASLKAEVFTVETKRDLLTGEVEIGTLQGDIRGRDIVIVDDVITTGGTLVKIIKRLKGAGARRIIAGCVHPILVNGADQKILEAGVESIVGTDTVPSRYSKVSVAPLLAETLKKV